MKLRILMLIAIALILGFGYYAVSQALKVKKEQKIESINIESKELNINKLELNLRELNAELKTQLKKKDLDKQKIKELYKKIDEAEQRERQLEADLQAKRQKQREDKERASRIAQNALNTVTRTQTVQASSGVEGIIRQAAVNHGLDPDWFVRLAQCESGLDPNIVNYNYYDNGHPSGLFQHISGYWPARAAQYGYSGASVFDPVANANVTAQMWRGGSHLWECQ